MKRNMIAALCVFSLVVCLEAHSHDTHSDGHTHHERGLEVSEDAAEAIGLATVKVEMRRVDSVKTVLARALTSVTAERMVSLPISGFVTIPLKVHENIVQGQEMLSVTSPDAATQYADILALSSRLKALREAGAKNASLEADLKGKESAYRVVTNALVVKDAAAGEFALVARDGGILAERLVLDGQFVERGTAVLKIRMNANPSLFALVPFHETVGLKTGDKAKARGRCGTLRIDRTRTDGLVGVWFDADEANTERFLPGDTVKIEMSAGMDEVPVPAIPKACVFRDGLETAVFVRDEDDDDRYVLRHVRIGKSANGWTQVKDLPVGMEVVSTGAYELKTALATGEGASRIAGHFHADGKFHAGDAEDDE